MWCTEIASARARRGPPASVHSPVRVSRRTTYAPPLAGDPAVAQTTSYSWTLFRRVPAARCTRAFLPASRVNVTRTLPALPGNRARTVSGDACGVAGLGPVSYTHLTLPTIYSV